MEALKYIKFKRKLKYSDIENQLVQIVEKRIHELADHNDLRVNPELVLLVCSLVENGAVKKTNKKELVMKILNNTFSYSNVEHKQVEDIVEFLWANGKIKKVSFGKKALAFCKDWIKRKFL